MRALVILNPASSRGDTSATESDVVRALESHGIEHELEVTERAGHATEILQRRGPEFDDVIAVGGDGTLHEVIQAIDLERHRLGLVPRGTGNDWAWANDWSSDLDECARRIAGDGERRIDVGVWRAVDGDGREWDGRFHNSVGCGFEAAVNEESRKIRRLRGHKVYVIASLRCLLRRRGYAVHMAWQGGSEGAAGEWRGEILQTSIGNGSRVGGAFFLIPGAVMDDGILDVCSVERVGFIRSLFLLPKAFRGEHTDASEVFRCRGRSLRIEAPEGLPVHVDGEYISPDIRELETTLHDHTLRTF